MEKGETRNFASPDETRTFGHGKMDIFNLGGTTVGRITLEPGWRWSQDVKPIAGTQWCEATHYSYHLSGTLHVLLEDGSEFDIKAGQLVFLPPRHDAWVVGEEPVVAIDWGTAAQYAKAKMAQAA